MDTLPHLFEHSCRIQTKANLLSPSDGLFPEPPSVISVLAGIESYHRVFASLLDVQDANGRHTHCGDIAQREGRHPLETVMVSGILEVSINRRGAASR